MRCRCHNFILSIKVSNQYNIFDSYPSRSFWCELFSFGGYQLERCLPSLQYDGTRWYYASGAQSDKNVKNPTSMSLSRNPYLAQKTDAPVEFYLGPIILSL